MGKPSWPEQVNAAQAAANPELNAAVEAMKGQLLLVLVQRLGGRVRIPASEVDDTGGLLLCMEVDGRDFVFSVERKN
jgi:hypothetical protein